MQDWLGNEYGEGDLVLYPRQLSHSTSITLGRVVTVREKTVTVMPVKSSRYKHWGRTRYIDTRTGKPIDPYRGDHLAEGGCYLNPDTGERTSDSHVARSWDRYEYRPHKDYIRSENTQSPVTLTVLENITRWPGEEPQEN